MPHRLKHALLTLAALIFLVEAWLWDKTIALGRWAVDLLPWRQFKEYVVGLIERLPPYGALPLFLIPLVVIEPLKFVAITQIAHGHFLRGLFTFVVLKFVGVGLIAFIFDLTREKLLAIDWFARFYEWVVMWRDRAHVFIEPYKAVVRAQVADLKARALDLQRSLNLSGKGGKGGFTETLARIRARVRSKAQN
jgi:hypothetical protein